MNTSTDFPHKVSLLAERSKSADKKALTEEATKTSVILPFIQLLGFDVFSLNEVIPEFTADVGINKGEKVDFAIKVDNKVEILIEAKPIGSKLNPKHINQLYRYFSVTNARLAILTNGREAWFFSDTEAMNKMDRKPFFTFDFQKHDLAQVEELARFTKDNFAIDDIIEAASNLKYVQKVDTFLTQQIDDPQDDLARLIAKNIHNGSITKSVIEQVKSAIPAAFSDMVRKRIEDRLSITLSHENSPKSASSHDNVDHQDNNGIITTDEEREAFMVIRAIGSKVAPPERITMRDSKTYCSIFMDDNNRRPICRLYFNSLKSISVSVFDKDKVETKRSIKKISDIYQWADEITETVKFYCT